MRIGEVAAKAGVSVRAMRYYEQQNLLQADCRLGGQRHYADTAVGRVRMIQHLYAAGLSSSTIREVLPCVDTGEVPPELLDRLTAERTHIDQRITELLAVRARLDEVIAAARNPDPECHHMQY
ncbi:MerR family transcriptional regulator [Streptomyces varsoviensis]|uniref:MerR family transcriptional regulator n=1 Tax=Streptomyces varsoviensis TaxID=67373 RepID=A0ABR5J9U4_9ACTN|nr:MerR family transcriptional regulator [Streptomyces varsoviensis]KOG90213.1 MerR family transcriptional regulator [Streptomyces varsoviensis]